MWLVAQLQINVSLDILAGDVLLADARLRAPSSSLVAVGSQHQAVEICQGMMINSKTHTCTSTDDLLAGSLEAFRSPLWLPAVSLRLLESCSSPGSSFSVVLRA